MKLLHKSFLLSLIIVASLFASVDILEITVDGLFLKPGSPAPINYTFMKNGAEDYGTGGVRMAAVLSNDQIWSNDDYLINYNGATLTPITPWDGTQGFNKLTDGANYTNGAWSTINQTITVPAGLLQGETWYIILRVGDDSKNWGTETTIGEVDAANKWSSELAVPFEVAVNKDLIYNTAYINEKSASAILVVKAGLPDAPLTADTGSTAFTNGDTITYTTTDLAVTLTSNAIATINYSGGTLSGSFAETGTINLLNEADSVTITATAIANGHDNTTNSWTFIRQLPSANISLDTNGTILSASNTVLYTTTTINANISTSNGDSLSYTINGGAEVGISGSSGTISIPGPTNSDTVDVIVTARGNGVITQSATWTFIRTLPAATVTLDTAVSTPAIPVGDTITYTTLGIIANVNTSNGDTITYSVGGTTPVVTPSSSTTIDLTGSSDTVDVVVTVTGSGVATTEVTWTFIRDLPPTYINASPISGTTFNFGLNVLLEVINGGAVVPTAKIYYRIGNIASPLAVDSTNGILYTNTGVDLTHTSTIYAVAYDASIPDLTGKFSYTMALIATPVTVSTEDGASHAIGDTITAANPSMTFGEALDLFPVSAADSLYYTIESGTEQLFTSGDTIHLLGSHPDTTEVHFRTAGHGYAPTNITYTFVRDTVEVLSANPAGQKFTGTLPVSLALSGTWENPSMYYTLDGSTPDSATATLYTGPITLNNTTSLRAIAYADFAVPSLILSEEYVYAISSSEAWYQDVDGDGGIDQAVITLTQPAAALPDSIQLIVPFSNDTVIASGAELAFTSGTDEITVTLATPFEFGGRNGSTYFVADSLGTLFGAEFHEEPFEIGDAVAPVIRYGTYVPGRINGSQLDEREADTLTVYFSEDITLISTAGILAFEAYAGTTYGIYFRVLSLDPDRITLAIDSLNGVTYPSSEDSISFDLGAQATDINNNIQNIAQHRRAPLDVTPIPMQIKSISGLDPSTTEIPSALASSKYNSANGFVVVIDYMTLLANTDNIDATVIILDPLGNTIAKSAGLNDSNKHLISDLIETDNRTRLVFYWSGQNRQGREVSSGAYYVHIRAKNIEGKTTEKGLAIGVKARRKNQ